MLVSFVNGHLVSLPKTCYLLLTEHVVDNERPSTSGLQSYNHYFPVISSSSDYDCDNDDVMLARKRISACVPVTGKRKGE